MMINETMTREQRLLTTITLGTPDRVPVSAMFDDFALRQKGLPPFGVDPAYLELKLQALHDNFNDLGGYDFQWHSGVGFAYSNWQGSCDIRVMSAPPGQDNTTMTPEKESISFEDYDKVIKLGWNGFCREFYPRTTGLSLEQINTQQENLFKIFKEDMKWWKERGVPLSQGGVTLNPEMILSLGRTLTQFTLDIYRHPDKVQAVLDAMIDDCIQNVLHNIKATGIPWANILLARGSSTFYNLPTFERFVFPYIKKMVTAFTSAGLFVNLHCDTNWILNLPYFKELPPGKCMVELDGTTDILKAKEILKGHMCIKGDVPATLLSLGKAEDVTAYCRRLIENVGKGGGFILSTGCTCPVDAKYENVKAMVDTAKNYYPH